MALPGTDVNLAGRAPARLAVHCNLATGGPGAATPHAPFGRPRRPLGTFPRGESTSSARRRAKPPTRNRFLAKGRKRVYLSFYRITKDFASAEATKGLSDRPLETFGALLLERIGFVTKTRILVEGRGKTFLAFPCFTKGFASAEATRGLSARPLDPFGGPLCDEMLASWEAERYLFATPTIFQ